MFRMPPILFVILLVLSSPAIAPPTGAQEGSRRPIATLAEQYRVAVNDFHQAIKQLRGIDRSDERLVKRLDEASARLRLAARNPRHFNRLFHDWRNVQNVHAEVESKIFATYTPEQGLVQAWNTVAYHYLLFAEEFYYQVESPGQRGTVRRIPENSARRDQYLQESSITPFDLQRLPSGAVILPPSP